MSLVFPIANRDVASFGAVPRLHDDGFVEPLLALYEPQVKEYFEELAAASIFRISRVSRRSKISTPVVPAHLAESWRNINTPEQLKKSLRE